MIHVSLEYALATMQADGLVYWALKDSSHNTLAACQLHGISMDESHVKLRDAISHIKGGVIALHVYSEPTKKAKGSEETKGGNLQPVYKWHINLGTGSVAVADNLHSHVKHDADMFKYILNLMEQNNRAIFEAKQEAAQARIDAQMAKLEAKYQDQDKGENLGDIARLLLPLLTKQGPAAAINEQPRSVAAAPAPAPENAKERLSAVLNRLTSNGVTLDHMEKIAGLVEQDPSLINTIAAL